MEKGKKNVTDKKKDVQNGGLTVQIGEFDKKVRFNNKTKRYSVYTAWGAEEDKSYCICNISGRVTKEDEKFNGENYISKSGSEGMEFFITDSLEKAIREANFDINQIRFYGMSKEDNQFINEFLAKYDWDPKNGIFEKEQGSRA